MTLLGQSLFPADNPWNQNISAAPVAANSSAIINHLVSVYGSAAVHPDFVQDYGTHAPLYGIPYNIAHGDTTASVPVVIDAYAADSNILPAPIPANAVLEGDYQDGPIAGVNNRGDSHLIVYDVDNNIAYEFYRASRPSENADGKWHADAESVWNMNTNTFRTLGETSADAAGLSILAGLVRPDEALPVSAGGQGVIDHAIRFTLPNATVLNQYVYPASHTANPGNTNPATQVPMGTRFRLKASFDISTLDPESQIIARAMQTYGMILADNGGNLFITGASASVDTNNAVSLTWNDADIQDKLHGLKSIPESAFEIVSLAPVVNGMSSSNRAFGSTIDVTGQNFSGAAGNLQVFFGSIPATSVSIVNDGLLTVGVPNGSGTVDVRVQSGVTVAPSSSNATSPIFGYGISPVSYLDRFTYGSAPATDTFVLSAPATAVAGTSIKLTLTAKLPDGSTDTAYSGSVDLTTTDVQAGLPADYTFTPADAGSHTFTVTLKSAGSQSILATDVANPAIFGGVSAINVSPAAFKSLSVTGIPLTTTAGVGQTFTVSAIDAFGNPVTNFTDPVAFTSTAWQDTLPAPYTFNLADAGTHSFAAKLKFAGSGRSITVTDTKTWTSVAITGITVKPAPMIGFTVSAPGTTVAGSPTSVVVTAVDAFGNVITNYYGSVQLTSSDALAVLPAAFSFTSANAGSHIFALTLKTAGTQTISATDVAKPTLKGTRWISETTPTIPATTLLVTASTSEVAGKAFSLTVAAKSSGGLTDASFTGTVHFSATDVQAGLPADYTFTKANAGAHTFTITLKTSGTQSLTVTNLANSAIKGSLSGIKVSPGALNALSVVGIPTTTTAGVVQSVTVSARDAYGNLVTNFTDPVSFTSSDWQNVMPAAYTFTTADAGSHTFNATLMIAGSGKSITVTDTKKWVVGEVTGITVNPAAVAGFMIAKPIVPILLGLAQPYVVTAVDAFGNVVTNYSGKVVLSVGDTNAILPASSSFIANSTGSQTFYVTLKTKGSWALSATDASNPSLNGSLWITV